MVAVPLHSQFLEHLALVRPGFDIKKQERGFERVALLRSHGAIETSRIADRVVRLVFRAFPVGVERGGELLEDVGRFHLRQTDIPLNPVYERRLREIRGADIAVENPVVRWKSQPFACRRVDWVSYDTLTSAPRATSQSSAFRSVDPVNTVVITRSRLPDRRCASSWRSRSRSPCHRTNAHSRSMESADGISCDSAWASPGSPRALTRRSEADSRPTVRRRSYHSALCRSANRPELFRRDFNQVILRPAVRRIAYNQANDLIGQLRLRGGPTFVWERVERTPTTRAT